MKVSKLDHLQEKKQFLQFNVLYNTSKGKGYTKVQTVLLKLILVLFTCSLAIAIPDLGDFIALIGACASSLLALSKKLRLHSAHSQ